VFSDYNSAIILIITVLDTVAVTLVLIVNCEVFALIFAVFLLLSKVYVQMCRLS